MQLSTAASGHTAVDLVYLIANSYSTFTPGIVYRSL